MSNQIYQVSLSENEALLLFELLSRLDEKELVPIEHPSEQHVLWNIEAQLEKQLPMLFAANYKQLVEEARNEVDSTD